MTSHLLDIDDLGKRYGDVVALDGMSFSVRGGEVFGFVGSNGAGKTTTMRIALGVLDADRGQVRFDGEPVTFATRRRIGYMPEERGLYPRMRVGEQLVYLARQLAAALVHDPDVLVLDEPFSGLDPVAVDVMSSVLLEQAAAGVPVVFSSHQLDLVERLCHRVGIVAAGRMVACGSVDDLRSGGRSDLVIDAPGAPPDWWRSVPGVVDGRREGAADVLQLDAGADDQVVLEAALTTGPVRSFTRRQQTLTELFRAAVASPEQAPADPSTTDPSTTDPSTTEEAQR